MYVYIYIYIYLSMYAYLHVNTGSVKTTLLNCPGAGSWAIEGW
jgi:hypothetical protein